MTKPQSVDKKASCSDRAIIKYNLNMNNNFSSWCYASLNEVKDNCLKANIDLKQLYFIQGDVSITLNKKIFQNQFHF
jgi:hypothetical protein